MVVHLLPVYKDIFPDEPVPDFDELLKQLPTQAVIRACCHINTELHLNDKSLEKEVEIFHYLIGRLGETGRKYSLCLGNFISKCGDKSIEIFPLQHTLEVIQKSFFLNVPGGVQEISAEQELALLKILLLLNTETNNRVRKSLSYKLKDKHEKLYAFFWCNLLPTISFIQRRDPIIGMYRSLHFLEYLQTHYPNYLKTYLEANKLDAYQKIPIRLFEWYVNSRKEDKNAFYSASKVEFVKQNGVIEQLTLSLDTNRRDEFKKSGYKKNLKLVREFPIIQTSDKDVAVTNFNFLIEKFCEGLLFDFFRKSGIENKLVDLGLFKSQVGEKFSQEFFTQIFKKLFTKNGIVTYGEEERNQNCNYDFYIRIRNCIFLFEFKDNLFAIKEDYPSIKEIVDGRLLGDKGIGQMVKQIQKLAATPDIFEDYAQEGYTLKELFIFPVLIYTDVAFGMNGINHYLNKNFSQCLKQEVKDHFYHVYPLATICFDYFLERYELFNSGKIDLIHLLHSFHTLMEARFASHKKWNTPETNEAVYDEFDQVIGRKFPSLPIQQLHGVFYNHIIEAFKPYLPKE